VPSAIQTQNITALGHVAQGNHIIASLAVSLKWKEHNTSWHLMMKFFVSKALQPKLI
jgi:hypothetical protein